jgi:hypothetical protein
MNSQLSLELPGSYTKGSLLSQYESGEVINLKDAMNPKGRAISDLRMTWRRAWQYQELIAKLLGDYNVDEVRANPLSPFSVPGAGRLANNIWGDTWWRTPDIRHNWDTLFDYFWHGAMRRNQERLAQNLPDKTLQEEKNYRKKYLNA